MAVAITWARPDAVVGAVDVVAEGADVVVHFDAFADPSPRRRL